MLTGRIVRFDEIKGYGFITPDNGDDDVFVHINELPDGFGEGGRRISTGSRVRFNVLDGGRGPKAYSVKMMEGDEQPVSRLVPAGPGTPQAVGQAAQLPGPAVGVEVAHRPVSPAPMPAPPANHSAQREVEESTEDELCEIFSEIDFERQITNLILDTAPELTGAQILKLRNSLLGFGRKNGWVD